MATYPGQEPVLQFPSDPATDQEFVGDNGVTYTWAGDRWSSTLSIVRRTARFIVDGEYADSTMNTILDGNNGA